MQSIILGVSFFLTFTILSILGQPIDPFALSTPATSQCCEDIAPPGMTLTCKQISDNNLCDFSNITSGNYCQKSCGSCGTTSQASSTCPEYDSKISNDYDHYDACVTAARNHHFAAKSASAAIACDVARHVEDLLRDCKDMATFEAEFTTFSTSKFDQYSDPNQWSIISVEVALEPYTFEGRPLYSQTQLNPDLDNIDDFVDNSNYYTDCESLLGEGCTWYHQGKLRTFYEEEGGSWLVKIEVSSYYGNDALLESFHTPIIVDGRFYGLVSSVLQYPA